MQLRHRQLQRTSSSAVKRQQAMVAKTEINNNSTTGSIKMAASRKHHKNSAIKKAKRKANMLTSLKQLVWPADSTETRETPSKTPCSESFITSATPRDGGDVSTPKAAVTRQPPHTRSRKGNAAPVPEPQGSPPRTTVLGTLFSPMYNMFSANGEDCETSDGEVKEPMDTDGTNDSSESESDSASSNVSTEVNLTNGSSMVAYWTEKIHALVFCDCAVLKERSTQGFERVQRSMCTFKGYPCLNTYSFGCQGGFCWSQCNGWIPLVSQWCWTKHSDTGQRYTCWGHADCMDSVTKKAKCYG